MTDTFHLYTDLAWLWPMWGDVTGGYAHYCSHLIELVEQHARRRPALTLLDIGCGGGKNVFNLKQRFQVTGLDLSPVMLAQARELNPECEFLQGDMRSVRLDRTFDVILVDDAITHMNCLSDFKASFQTAFEHLQSGGVLIATPDITTETFQQNRTIVTPAAPRTTPDGFDVVFVENTYDPDPADEHYETTILYLIREDGRLRITSDHWKTGIFSLETWRQVISESGLLVHEGSYDLEGERYTVFACQKL